MLRRLQFMLHSLGQTIAELPEFIRPPQVFESDLYPRLTLIREILIQKQWTVKMRSDGRNSLRVSVITVSLGSCCVGFDVAPEW